MSQTRLPNKLWRGLALLLLVPAMSQAIEEPAYEVVQKLGESVEIRRYAAYVVAEVLIAGPVTKRATRPSRSWPATSSARTRASESSR